MRAGLEITHGTGLAATFHRETHVNSRTPRIPRGWGHVWIVWAGWSSGTLLGLQRQAASGLAAFAGSRGASSLSLNGWVHWNVSLLSRWHLNGCLLLCSPNTGTHTHTLSKGRKAWRDKIIVLIFTGWGRTTYTVLSSLLGLFVCLPYCYLPLMECVQTCTQPWLTWVHSAHDAVINPSQIKRKRRLLHPQLLSLSSPSLINDAEPNIHDLRWVFFRTYSPSS